MFGTTNMQETNKNQFWLINHICSPSLPSQTPWEKNKTYEKNTMHPFLFPIQYPSKYFALTTNQRSFSFPKNPKRTSTHSSWDNVVETSDPKWRRRSSGVRKMARGRFSLGMLWLNSPLPWVPGPFQFGCLAWFRLRASKKPSLRV